MTYAPISAALRTQLATEDPEWLDENFGLDALRQRAGSQRFYMTVDEGINHFRRWNQSDRDIARKAADFTKVRMAYAIPSGSYIAFVGGAQSTIEFTATLGVLQGGHPDTWSWFSGVSGERKEILPGAVTRVELSLHVSSQARGTISAPTRLCTKCFLELPLTELGTSHAEC